MPTNSNCTRISVKWNILHGKISQGVLPMQQLKQLVSPKVTKTSEYATLLLDVNQTSRRNFVFVLAPQSTMKRQESWKRNAVGYSMTLPMY